MSQLQTANILFAPSNCYVYLYGCFSSPKNDPPRWQSMWRQHILFIITSYVIIIYKLKRWLCCIIRLDFYGKMMNHFTTTEQHVFCSHFFHTGCRCTYLLSLRKHVVKIYLFSPDNIQTVEKMRKIYKKWPSL